MADLEFDCYLLHGNHSFTHACIPSFRAFYVVGTIGDADSTKKDKILSLYLNPCDLLEVRDKHK